MTTCATSTLSYYIVVYTVTLYCCIHCHTILLFMLHFLWDNKKQLSFHCAEWELWCDCCDRIELYLLESFPFLSVVDETRVKLNDEENDYINANYVKVNPLDTHTHTHTHTHTLHTHPHTHTHTHTHTYTHTHTHTHTHMACNRALFPGSPLHPSRYEKCVRLVMLRPMSWLWEAVKEAACNSYRHPKRGQYIRHTSLINLVYLHKHIVKVVCMCMFP